MDNCSQSSLELERDVFEDDETTRDYDAASETDLSIINEFEIFGVEERVGPMIIKTEENEPLTWRTDDEKPLVQFIDEKLSANNEITAMDVSKCKSVEKTSGNQIMDTSRSNLVQKKQVCDATTNTDAQLQCCRLKRTYKDTRSHQFKPQYYRGNYKNHNYRYNNYYNNYRKYNHHNNYGRFNRFNVERQRHYYFRQAVLYHEYCIMSNYLEYLYNY